MAKRPIAKRINIKVGDVVEWQRYTDQGRSHSGPRRVGTVIDHDPIHWMAGYSVKGEDGKVHRIRPKCVLRKCIEGKWVTVFYTEEIVKQERPPVKVKVVDGKGNVTHVDAVIGGCTPDHCLVTFEWFGIKVNFQVTWRSVMTCLNCGNPLEY